MILLFDIGNTHTHVGLVRQDRLGRVFRVDTAGWARGQAAAEVDRRVRLANVEGAVVASVVPRATPWVRRYVRRRSAGPCVLFTARTPCGLPIDYPKPATIGADRLANALAARCRYGAPVLVLDVGTALTLDVVDRRGYFVGGVIAPGPAAMTGYLAGRTALLPRVRLREPSRWIGRSTQEAMRIGILAGYRGLVRHLIQGVVRELGDPRVPVVATGGGAARATRGLSEVRTVLPALTLEGLLWVWRASQRPEQGAERRLGGAGRAFRRGGVVGV